MYTKSALTVILLTLISVLMTKFLPLKGSEDFLKKYDAKQVLQVQ